MKISSSNNSKYSKNWLLPVAAIILLLVIISWLTGAFNYKIAPAIMPVTTTSSELLAIDKSFKVTTSLAHTFESVPASITAKQATVISSRLLARINSINVRSGDKVQQGDILITLESNELQAQVIEAKEYVNATQARYNEAKQNFSRAQELFKKKLVSAFDLDKSKADYQSYVAQLTAAEQSLKRASTMLSYATLRAPIDGTIVDRFAEPGNTAQAGNKLLTLYNPLSLRVEAQVREKLALQLQMGQSLQVILPTINRTLQGSIEEIVPAANTGSRTFLIKISLPFHEKLLPGMYARLSIPSGTANQQLIPKQAIHQVGQLIFVWVVINNQPQRRFIRIGEENTSQRVSVISGLEEGDNILLPAS